MSSPGQKTDVRFSVPTTRTQAEAIYTQGREVMVFVLMELAARLAQHQQDQPAADPSTPSGMIPPYEKPTARKRRKKPAA